MSACGTRKTAEDIVELVESKAREAYARREIEYPVDQVLSAFGPDGQGAIENPYAADYVRAWAAAKWPVAEQIEMVRAAGYTGIELVSGLGGKPGRAPSYVPSSNFAVALIATLAADDQASLNAEGIRTLVSALPPSNVRQVMHTIVNDAGGDLARIRAGIEAWYNAAMDRVSRFL